MRINIFEKLWQRKPQPEEKAVRAIPKYGRERIWFVWSNHWITLIEMNLLFVLLCIPIITIPAALAGMTRVIMLWTRDAPTVDFWPTFFKSFKKGFFERLLFWLVVVLPPVSTALMLAMAGSQGKGTVVFFLLGAVSFLIQCYWFPLMETIELPVGQCLKNALILIALEWKTSLKLLFGVGILYAVGIVFYLYAIPVAVICLFSFPVCIICAWVNEVAEKRRLIINGTEPTQQN